LAKVTAIIEIIGNDPIIPTFYKRPNITQIIEGINFRNIQPWYFLLDIVICVVKKGMEKEHMLNGV